MHALGLHLHCNDNLYYLKLQQMFFKQLSAIYLLMNISLIAFSQQEWRNWNSAILNISIIKNLDIRLAHLRTYDITDNFRNGFNQSSISLAYDFTKKVNFLGGYMRTQFPESGTGTYRFYSRITHKFSIAYILSWSNGIQAEIHSAAEKKYRTRFIYITRISNKKRFKFLNLNLSTAYWLYYNHGGNTIKYYDKTGNIIGTNSPDGFHRGRLFLTANSKISKNFSVALYYMQQHEFNFFNSRSA